MARRRAFPTMALVMVSALIASVSVQTANAFPGQADPSFGSGNAVSVDLGGADRANAVVALADGNLVVAGTSDFHAVIARLTSAGGLDSTFGTSGKTVSDFGGGTGAIKAMARQSDGKLVVVGTATAGGPGTFHLVWAVARYSADGALDGTFGTSGIALFDSGTDSNGEADAVLIDPTGRVVVAGFVSPGGSAPQYGLVMRLTSTGGADSSFGTAGLASVTGDEITVLARQGDGKLVAGSHSGLARLTSAGAPDTSFGTSGVAPFGLIYGPSGLVIQPSGRIVALGGDSSTSGSSGHDLMLSGYTSTGAIDTTFGDGGLVRTDVTFNHLARYARGGDLLSQSDGRLVVVGDDGINLLSARFWPNGQPDEGYGFRGVTARFAGQGNAGVIAANGAIVVAGETLASSPSDDTTVARFRPGTATFVNGYELDGLGGTHPFNVSPADAPLDLSGQPYWPHFDIARGMAPVPDGSGGYVVDGYGGMHPYAAAGGAAPVGVYGPYWNGWDIVRGASVLAFDKGGFVLDGYGGLHPFVNPYHPHEVLPGVTGGPYWNGWDISRGVALLPDETGGYILDGYGGLHPFGLGSHAAPPLPSGGPYWNGWDVARGVSILPDGTGGYVVDGWGGLHPFAIGANPLPAIPGNTPYWPGWSIVHGVALVPCGACRHLVDSEY